MNNKVKETLNSILECFKSGSIPEIVSYSIFPIPENIPSSKWSLLNRTIQFIGGTCDSRGFKQWQEVERHVIKGEKSHIFILVPYIKKTKDKDTNEEKDILCGFVTRPVFAYEQTEGKELDYMQIELPELPLMDIAKKWNINVKAVPGNYKYYGYYSQDRKEIGLATSEEKTFFHELAHSAHSILKGNLKNGQDPLQEIVAELSAATLTRIVGKKSQDTLGNSYRYIEEYAEKLEMSPYTGCIRVLNETEKVLELILKCEGKK
ncbi:MAG: antirestriction protein [Pseudomonadota bacterium]